MVDATQWSIHRTADCSRDLRTLPKLRSWPMKALNTFVLYALKYKILLRCNDIFLNQICDLLIYLTNQIECDGL